MSRKGQYIFELTGIKFKELIDECYFFKKENVTTDYDNSTNVTNLLPNNNKFTFRDLNKSRVRHLTSMVDVLSQKYLPICTDKPCWWCGYTFDSCPIGLPIRYYPNTTKPNEIHTFLKTRNLPIYPNEYFETEGVFCSFPCCKAYILDKRFITKYKNSLTLLTLLYTKLYGKTEVIPKAPSWQLLELWSGSLTIEQFRKSFEHTAYHETPNIKRPFMFTVGNVFEEVKNV